MTIHDDIVCDNIEDAVAFINSHDSGFYDDHAVRFKERKSSSKKIETLKERCEKIGRIKVEFAKKHSVQNRTSSFISCPKCKSRLSLAYLRGEHCPLCNADLRAQSTIDQIDKYNAKQLELSKKIEEEKKKCALTGKCKWLVKVEVHS